MTEPSSDDHATVRRTVIYTGRVQGVGFRYTTCDVAADYDVTGYVKNLRDGRVELVAEGRSEEVDRFLDGVADALGGYVRDTQITASPATGQFNQFDVAY
jgi:acylphosphatase